MARASMTIRLDPQTRIRLASASRRRGRTPSALARAALTAWLDGEEGTAGMAPYEAVVDLIGCVRGGDPKRSIRRASEIRDALRRRGRKPAR